MMSYLHIMTFGNVSIGSYKSDRWTAPVLQSLISLNRVGPSCEGQLKTHFPAVWVRIRLCMHQVPTTGKAH
jgi:hypothetical protein